MLLEECTFPWFDMQIIYDGQMRCCCYFAEKGHLFANSKLKNSDDYWNSSGLQSIRNNVISSKLSFSPCQNCQHLKYGSSDLHKNIPSDLNNIQINNWNR